jgi:hypothetical protein
MNVISLHLFLPPGPYPPLLSVSSLPLCLFCSVLFCSVLFLCLRVRGSEAGCSIIYDLDQDRNDLDKCLGEILGRYNEGIFGRITATDCNASTGGTVSVLSEGRSTSASTGTGDGMETGDDKELQGQSERNTSDDRNRGRNKCSGRDQGTGDDSSSGAGEHTRARFDDEVTKRNHFDAEADSKVGKLRPCRCRSRCR